MNNTEPRQDLGQDPRQDPRQDLADYADQIEALAQDAWDIAACMRAAAGIHTGQPA